MAYYPFAQQTGAHYVIVGPDGWRIAFNDQGDPDFVGFLTEVTGLDSPDVRESATELVGTDGGTHGDFYFGRRPMTFTGMSAGHATASIRDLRMAKLRRATNALRGDASLTWKPAVRVENLVENPRAANVVSGTWGQTSPTTITRVTSAIPGGLASGYQWAGNVAATSASFSLGKFGGTTVLTGGLNVQGGRTYSVRFLARLTAVASGTVSNLQGRVNWYKADGTAASTAFSTVQTINTPGIGADQTIAGDVTAPSDAAYGVVTPFVTITNPTNFTMNLSGFNFALSTSAPVGYNDGDTAGWYWQGNAHESASGDFIELYVPVRLQNRRFSGAWAKEFQLGLVSEYAVVFSAKQKSATGTPVTVENRGDYPAYPILRIDGVGVAPTVTVDPTDAPDANFVLTTVAGLTVASGEAIEFDTLNHTATFVAGARNGQSGNRYIDFSATSRWPNLPYGFSTVTRGGSGTFSLRWRDVWA